MTPFGLTTTVFRGRRFGAQDVADIARAGFESLNLVAADGHLDSGEATQLDDITRAAAADGIAIGSVSVPVERLLDAIPIALDRDWPLVVARHGPCRLFVERGRALPLAALLEKAAALLPDRGCRIAVQGPGGAGLSADAIVALLESLDDPRVGVCFDAGHARLSGGAPESAEVLSGLVMTTLLHDGAGRDDAHRAPGEGALNWPAVLMACWKTGYSGPWVIDVADEAGRADPLTRAVGARTRLQAILDDLAQPMVFTE